MQSPRNRVRALSRLLVEQARALPPGTVAVAGGIGVVGLTSYGFLTITASALTPPEYAVLSVFWSLVVSVGPGVFLPLEQEVARAVAARRATHQGVGPVTVRAGILGGAILVGFVVATGVSQHRLTARLFGGHDIVTLALAVSLAGYGIEHFGRGILAGLGRFGRYAAVLVVEGAFRLGGAVLIVGLADGSVGSAAMVLALAPLAAAVALGDAGRAAVSDGPPAPWTELSSALGLLLLASLASNVLINAGPVLIGALAEGPDEALAGRFLPGMILARAPLFVFAAVQAALLPRFSTLAARLGGPAFRSLLFRMMVLVTALSLLGTLALVATGPVVLGNLFGRDYILPRRDLALLAIGSGLYMACLVLAQALIALRRYRAVLGAWVFGCVAMAAVTATPVALILRVELALCAGAGAALGALAIALRGQMPVRPVQAAQPEPGPSTGQRPDSEGRR